MTTENYSTGFSAHVNMNNYERKQNGIFGYVSVDTTGNW